MSMGCHSCAEKVAFNLSVPGLSDYVEHGFKELYKSAADHQPCSHCSQHPGRGGSHSCRKNTSII
jgi:hypothetical protein